MICGLPRQFGLVRGVRHRASVTAEAAVSPRKHAFAPKVSYTVSIEKATFFQANLRVVAARVSRRQRCDARKPFVFRHFLARAVPARDEGAVEKPIVQAAIVRASPYIQSYADMTILPGISGRIALRNGASGVCR